MRTAAVKGLVAATMVHRVFAWDEWQVSPSATSGVVTGASPCTSDVGVGRGGGSCR
jgi:hypothetical protein